MAIYKQSAFMEPSSMLLSRPNGHSRCSFLWHAMCIRPPLKLGHTEHRAHTLITSLISPIFYSFNVSWKDKRRKNSTKISITVTQISLPPKKYYGLEQNFGQRRTSSSSSQASQGATPIITKWQDFLTITILAQTTETRDTSFSFSTAELQLKMT